MPKYDNKPSNLITFRAQTVGFVCRGLGGGAYHHRFRGEILVDYLERLGKQMLVARDEGNAWWRSLNLASPGSTKNCQLTNRFLGLGLWAYGTVRQLNGLQKVCAHGPTNPLRQIYLDRLEEMFTKCFAVAHLYGGYRESAAGLHGLLDDFEDNGGVAADGGPGNGLSMTVYLHFVAYFYGESREPHKYQKFAEWVVALAELVNKYPACAPALGEKFRELIISRDSGFGSNKITSPAKDELRRILAEKSDLLARKAAA